MKWRFALSASALLAGLFAGIPSTRALVSFPPRALAPPGSCRWVPPAYRTVTENTWVPERADLVPEWLEISPGHIERVWRQSVTPGHWTTSTRQVLISEGRWELVAIVPPPVILPAPWQSRPVTVGVEGYTASSGEDLHRFSGLSDWPADK